MKFNLLGIFVIFSTCLSGQLPFKGNYYTFDTIPNGDSINYYLRYIEINNADLRCIIYPIILIEADWADSDYNRFNLKNFEGVYSGKGKIFQAEHTYFCNVLLSKGQDFSDNYVNGFIKESFLSISSLNDSTLNINSKIFKKDSELKIYRRFNAY